MAKVEVTVYTDDVTGKSGDDVATRRFIVDGREHEIDLSDDQNDKLSKILEDNRQRLAKYLDAARPIKSAKSSGRAGNAKPSGLTRDQSKAIRAWAAKKKIDVAPRGRIKQDIIDQYNADLSGGTPPRRASSKPKPYVDTGLADRRDMLSQVQGYAGTIGVAADHVTIKNLTEAIVDAFSEGNAAAFSEAVADVM